jgi:hypothetical protein
VALAKPVAASLSGLKYPDGGAVAVADVGLIGVFAFRGASAAEQMWDEAARRWRPTPSDNDIMNLKPLPATAASGGGAAWTATLVAIGQKDSAGADVYVAASGGSPKYYLRAFARARRAGSDQSGLSVPTAAFTFADDSVNNRFTTKLDNPPQLDSAHVVRMQLKSDALLPAGYLEIRSQPGFEVEIANCDAAGVALAKFLLRSNGEIHLTPGAGARIVLDGDVETGRVLYQPGGGGPKQWLP